MEYVRMSNSYLETDKKGGKYRIISSNFFSQKLMAHTPFKKNLKKTKLVVKICLGLL